jgi:hypothetical protein
MPSETLPSVASLLAGWLISGREGAWDGVDCRGGAMVKKDRNFAAPSLFCPCQDIFTTADSEQFLAHLLHITLSFTSFSCICCAISHFLRSERPLYPNDRVDSALFQSLGVFLCSKHSYDVVTNFLYLITLRHPDSVLLIADALRHPQLVLVIHDSSLTRPLTYLFSAC